MCANERTVVEDAPFSPAELESLLALGRKGVDELVASQKAAIGA